MEPGILIAIDGIDGAGKTTQVRMLKAALEVAGETVVASKEPTDGPWGRRLRESAQTGRLSLSDELHAFIEDRKEHVAKVIEPALNDGAIVILDRFLIPRSHTKAPAGEALARYQRRCIESPRSLTWPF